VTIRIGLSIVWDGKGLRLESIVACGFQGFAFLVLWVQAYRLLGVHVILIVFLSFIDKLFKSVAILIGFSLF
jgi:hypothetical protein